MLVQERELNATEYAQLLGTTTAVVRRAFETGRLSAMLGANDGRTIAESAEESLSMRRERIAAQLFAAHMLDDAPFDEDLIVEEAVRLADKLARQLASLDKFDLQQLNLVHQPGPPADANPRA